MDNKEGEIAVQIARKVVDSVARFQKPKNIEMPESFNDKRGVFVTLSTYPEHDLRGCIGYPEPIYPFAKALVLAAESACHDPRFPPLREEELMHIVVEVSVLTPPQPIKTDDPRKLPELITVGEDGLIVEIGPFRGLLLPQVPVEYGWNAEEFLEHTCMKAGLTPDCWLDKRSRFLKFQAEIFAEKEPYGAIVRKTLK